MDKTIDDGRNIMIKLRFVESSLSISEKKVAKVIAERPSEVINYTLNEYSKKAGCSEATVIRFCKKLDLNGLPELRARLLFYLSNHEKSVPLIQEISPQDSMNEILGKVFRYNIQTLEDTLALVSDQYDEALKALASSKSISFYCIGDAAVPAHFANIKLSRLGINCQVHVDADMQLISAGTVGENDVVIAISYSGRSKSVVESIKIAKENGATTICITKQKESPLTELCGIKLYTATTDVTTGKEIIARRIAEHAILEALYLGLVIKERPELYENIRKTTDILKKNKIM